MDLVELYDGDIETFEKCLLIESVAYPLILENNEKKDNNKEDKGPKIPNKPRK